MHFFRKSSVLVLILGSIALVGCASNPKRLNSDQKAQLMIEAADGALREGDPVSALQILDEAERLSPDNSGIYHKRAVVMSQRKDYPAALEWIGKALEVEPKNSGILNTYGTILVESGKLKEAITPLMAAASDYMFREAYKSRTSLGIIHYKLGDNKKAIDSFNLAIESSPVAACVAYYYRGHVALREGRFTAAVRDYDAATRKYCATFGDAHLALGVAYERSRDYDKARKKFLDVQKIFPNTQIADKAMEHLRNLP